LFEIKTIFCGHYLKLSHGDNGSERVNPFNAGLILKKKEKKVDDLW